MKPISSALAGVGAGVTVAYFLDPTSGPRRRAGVRDTFAHSAVITRRAIGATSRDVAHRAQGTAASLRRLIDSRAPDDAIVVERVRAQLGRLLSHPRAVDVFARDGVVTLAGPVLKRECETLLRKIRAVRGVTDVIDALDVHEQAGNVPSLQGGTAPAGNRVDLFQDNWAPATRTMVGAAGVALTISGLSSRRAPGAIAQVIGLGLIARAVTNLPARRLLGIGAGRRAVDVQKTIHVDAPVGEVFAFWSEYANFPRFMSRVLDVRVSDRAPRLSHWSVAGPAGVPVSFDAQTTRVIPNREIAWRTLSGAPVAHAGLVRFDREPDGRTRVHVRMSYNPPAGWFGHEIAAAVGADPKNSMDQDLARMKTLIETGRAAHDAARRLGEMPS
jgi:uncharacterized membrane protein